jgi:hypothetical protein
MMKNLMTLGSLTRDKEFEEDQCGRDMIPVPKEEAVMMVYGGRPPPGWCRMSDLSPGTPTRYGQEPKNKGM